MAKKESRRNESIRLAIAVLLLAISQAFAPPLLLGGKFWPGPTGEKRQSKLVLEAGKHDWLGLAHAKPDPKHKGSIDRRECLRWHPGAKVHCIAAGGSADAGIRHSHDNDGGSRGTDAGGGRGSALDTGGLDSGDYIVIGDFIGASSGGGSGGQGAGSGGSGADGVPFFGSGGSFSGSTGGGSIGGASGGDGAGGGGSGSGSPSGDDNASGGGSGGDGAGGGAPGSGSPSGGDNSGGGGSGGDGAGGGGPGSGSPSGGDNSSGGGSGGDGSGGGGSGSGSASGGDNSSGDGAGGVDRIFSDPAPGCGIDNPSACIPGVPDANGSDCSLKNTDACAPDGNASDTDCPDPKLCQLPLADVVPSTTVPEPSTLWLVGAGIAALAAARRRKKVARHA